jgi:hypothetical protein
MRLIPSLRISTYWALISVSLCVLGCPTGTNQEATDVLGLVFLEPDEYNSIPLANAPLGGSLPAQVDLSDSMPPAGDQGRQPSCVAWAVAHARACQLVRAGAWNASDTAHRLSPAFIYNQVHVGDCQGGARYATALNLLHEQGCAPLADMPYDDASCDSQPGPDLRTKAATYAIDYWRRINQQDPAEVKAHLAAGAPVLVGIRIHGEFEALRSAGANAIYATNNGAYEGGHAVVVVGYDDGRARFKALNSYGTSWGDAGYFYIAYTLWPQVAREAYVMSAQDTPPSDTEPDTDPPPDPGPPLDASWQPLPGMTGTLHALTVYNDELVAGGRTSSDNIGRWNGSFWRTLGSGIGDEVRALTVYNGELIAGGEFTRAGGLTCNSIARWDGSVWQPLGSGMAGGWGLYSSVEALTVYNGDLIAGGDFTEADGVSCNCIARWNGSVWQPLGSGMAGGFITSVDALTVFNGDLIAGGNFTNAGGVTCNYIARWNGSAWQPLWSGMSYYVWDLAVYNGELIAGGGFTRAGGVTCNYIARWNGSVWQPLGSGMSDSEDDWPYPSVGALTVYNGELIAGGTFDHAGGVECKYIARWNGSAWQPLGSGMDDAVFTLTAYDGALIAGGAFSTAGGVTSDCISRWGP